MNYRESNSSAFPELTAFREELLAGGYQERRECLLKRRWLSVPVEMGPLIDWELASRFPKGDAFCDDDALGARAIAVQFDLSRREATDIAVEIKHEPQAFEEWDVEYSWSDWLLTTSIDDFAVMCFGVYNFVVVLGGRPCIEHILGMTAESAVKAFQRFNSRYDYEPDLELHQQEVEMALSLLGELG